MNTEDIEYLSAILPTADNLMTYASMRQGQGHKTLNKMVMLLASFDINQSRYVKQSYTSPLTAEILIGRFKLISFPK